MSDPDSQNEDLPEEASNTDPVRGPGIEILPIFFAVSLALVLGVFVYVREQALTPLFVIPVLVPLAVYLYWTRRDRRRRRLVKRPFSDAWREILEREVAFYRELSPGERERFEAEVLVFLHEHSVKGPRGAPLEDELRLLVAASAVMLVFGRPGTRYPRLRDIVVYDAAFDDETYEVRKDGSTLGMVHAQGPILFSARSLRNGFRNPHDGRNVGLHEFAHVLDFDTGDADGVPSLMPWSAVRPWLEVMHEETAKVEANRSVLGRYAATNPAEFFAVATEAFFEKPKQLEKRHPELYEILGRAFRQDPAREHPE